MSSMDIEEWSFTTNGELIVEERVETNATNSGKNEMNGQSMRSEVKSEDKPIERQEKRQNYKEFNVLYIRDFKRSDDLRENNVLMGFTNHTKMGSFRIESNQSYNDLNCNQNLINDSIDLESICKMNINLMEGFENSLLISDYKSYKLLKWKYFLKWIKRSQYLDNRSAEALPHFISFGGLFTSLLMTPNRIESWSLLVSKYKDCIFMNKIRLNDSHFNSKRLNTELTEIGFNGSNGNNEFVDKNPFLASKVTQIITQSNGESINPVINEFEKHFDVYETQIGEHRLLLMSEMDAIDEEGNQYEIKCAKKGLRYGQKLMNWWSHCVVADIDYILIGLRDNDEMLTEINKLKVEELPEMSEFRWNTTKSYDFVNRVLEYIKDVLKSAKDCETYRVYFWKREDCVKSTKMNGQTLLPNWFVLSKQQSEELTD